MTNVHQTARQLYENIPQMQTFQAQPPANTNDTTIAEEPSMDATVDVTQDEVLKDDTIDNSRLENSSTPLKARDASMVDADEQTQEEEEDEQATGTSVLPLSRIRKIFKTDPEHVTASEASIFTTAIATELFVQYFTEQASLIARSEKRKKLQYKDFSAAVSNIEQLYFLADTVPKTHNLEGLVKTNKVKYAKTTELSKGQHTLPFGRKIESKKDDDGLEESDEEDLGDINDAEGHEENDTNDEGVNTDDEDEVANTSSRVDNDHDIIMVD